MRKRRRSFPVVAACFALLLCLTFVLGAVPASAALNVRTDKAVYNLGDNIIVNYDFSRDQDFSGLLKLSLFCTGSELEFYTLPTNLNAGEKQEVSVPPLSIASSMLGRCYVAANATSFDKSVSEGSTSNFFNITSNVSVALLLDRSTYLPSQSVEVSGTVGKSHGLPASVVLDFLGTKYTSAVADNAFAYSIKLPKSIKSGKHNLFFSVNDSYGNYGLASASFTVQSVPTRIVNTLSSQSVRPGENFFLTVMVYDQADDALDSQVLITIADSAGNAVMSLQNYTGANITLAFPSGQPPGAYALTSSGKGLSESSQMVVEEVESVSVTYSNGTVILNNTGNVNYAKAFNITLSGKKTYLVVENVDIKPGQTFEVDLTKDVSEGEYSVSFPALPDVSSVGNTYVEDRRSLIKKTSDFLGVTGTNVKVVAAETGKPQGNPLPLLLLMVFVIVALVGLSSLRKKGRSGGFGRGSRRMEGGGEGSAVEKSSRKPQSQETAEDEEAKVRRIIEEKRRQLMARLPAQPGKLSRDSPETKKFLRDMMKDKPFR